MMDEKESNRLLTNEPVRKYQHHKIWRPILLASLLVNILLSCAIITYLVCLYYTPITSYERGFNTDLGPIKSKIGLVQRRFTGGEEVDQNGHFVKDERGSEYIKPPSPQVDAAWDRLLLGINIDVPSDSDAEMAGKTYQWTESGSYFSGLEVFHSLHCLNRLRQALYPDYYHAVRHSGDKPWEEHIGHCINHLRQAVQCHGDLTPMEWKLVENKLVLKTNVLHTCRDFESIHQWAVKRETKYDSIEALKNGSIFITD